VGIVNDVGMVVVVSGSVSGLSPSRSIAFTQEDLAGNNPHRVFDRFGSGLSASRVDQTNGHDLFISVLFDGTESEGTVHFVPGSSELLDLAAAQTLTLGSAQPTMNQRYGDSVVAADIDGDGYKDVIVGVSRWDSVAAGAGSIGFGGAVEVLFTGPLFADGFESGDTSSWSSAQP
jgi:hypothetical protein